MTQWACWKQALIGLAALVSFSLFAQETLSSQEPLVEQQVGTDTPKSIDSSKLTYVGSEACIDCHKKETEAWQGSHHDMAMRHADAESVLGDFDDHTFTFEGKPNRFYRKGEEYWVNIQGPDGE